MKKVSGLLAVLLLFFSLYSCQKDDLENPLPEKDISSEEMMSVKDKDPLSYKSIQKQFKKKKYEDKLYENFNDTSRIYWEPLWEEQTQKVISDSVNFYYIPLRPTLINIRNGNKFYNVNADGFRQYIIVKQGLQGIEFFMGQYIIDRTDTKTNEQGNDFDFNTFSGELYLQNLEESGNYKFIYKNGKRGSKKSSSKGNERTSTGFSSRASTVQCTATTTCTWQRTCAWYGDGTNAGTMFVNLIKIVRDGYGCSYPTYEDFGESCTRAAYVSDWEQTSIEVNETCVQEVEPTDPTQPDPYNPGGDGGMVGSEAPESISYYYEERIITNALEGTKAECVYNRIKSHNSIKPYLEEFDGDFPVAHLKFNLRSDMSSDRNAITYEDKDGYTIVISINRNTLHNRTELGLARTMLHEIIHAEMYRKIISVGYNVNKDNYPGIYDYYRRFGDLGQHNLMAAHYINFIGDALADFDEYKYPIQYYRDVAWAGLISDKDKNGNIISTAAWNDLTDSERARILYNINHSRQGTKDCN